MRIAITGGGGYVGSALVPYLLERGHRITVLDTFWFGDYLPEHPDLKRIVGDIRNSIFLKAAFAGADAIIHLACVSNDPSFALNPLFAASVNGVGTFREVLRATHECGATKFIYASSSSIYGVSDAPSVTEDHPKAPLTDYSRCKLACEQELQLDETLDWTILRPATVCGWAPRLRLDVVVNAMTAAALRTGMIPVHGGQQMRASLHIADMCRAYEAVLTHPQARQKIFNVGHENLKLLAIANCVREMLGMGRFVVSETTDPRSYHICSDLIWEKLGFSPSYTIENAITSIQQNLWAGQHTNNLARLQQVLAKGAL